MQQIQRLKRAEAVQIGLFQPVHDLLRERRENRQLQRPCVGGFVAGQVPHGAALGALMFGQHFARAMHHIRRQPGQFGDLDAVTLIGGAFLHLAQKDNAAAALLHRHVIILHPAEPVGQLRQFVVVRGKQRLGAGVGVDVFDRRPGDGQAVIGRGAAAHFVQQDERARRRGVQNRGGLRHLDHEGRAPASKIVGRADASEDAVHQSQAR